MRKLCIVCIMLMAGCKGEAEPVDSFMENSGGKAQLKALYFSQTSTSYAIVESEGGDRKKIAVFPSAPDFTPMVVGDVLTIYRSSRGTYRVTGIYQKAKP